MNRIKNLIVKIYEFIFKQPMSGEAKLFTKNLGIISFGYIISLIFAFLFQVLAGRILGPSEYGKYGLVNSVAMFLYIPMLLGISSALIKYNAKEEDAKKRSENISSAYNSFFVFSILSAIILFLLTPYLAHLFSVPKELFWLSIAFAFLYSLDTLGKSALRSLHEIKKLSFIYSSYGIVTFLTFFTLYFLDKINYTTAVYSTLTAYAFAILVGFSKIFHYLHLKIDLAITKKMIFYGVVGLMGAISSSFLANTNKILINKFLSTDLLGIYNAYHSSSINLIFLANTMLMTIFFPTAAKLDSQKPMIEKLNKVSPYLYAFTFLGILIAQSIIILLYGHKYPYDIKLMFLFSIACALILVYGLYAWTYAAEGIRGVKIANLTSVFIAAINLGLSFILIPRINLYGAAISILFSYLIGVIICLKMRYKFL